MKKKKKKGKKGGGEGRKGRKREEDFESFPGAPFVVTGRDTSGLPGVRLVSPTEGGGGRGEEKGGEKKGKGGFKRGKGLGPISAEILTPLTSAPSIFINGKKERRRRRERGGGERWLEEVGPGRTRIARENRGSLRRAWSFRSCASPSKRGGKEGKKEEEKEGGRIGGTGSCEDPDTLPAMCPIPREKGGGRKEGGKEGERY